MKNKIIGAAMLALCLAGCVSVPIKSVRMPTIDTSNIGRLAIRPFEHRAAGYDLATQQLARYLTDTTTQKIASTGKFTIVSYTDPNADGIFTGEIRSIVRKDSQEKKELKDSSGNPVKDANGNPVYQITHIREVSLEFTYYILSSRTNMPIGGTVISKTGSTKESNIDLSKISGTLDMAKRIADSELRYLENDIVPVIVTTSRTLMDETSKDKVVKERMKAVLALVKNGNYQEAIRQYDDIARVYGSVAATTNAGILRESIASDIAARARMNQLDRERSGLTDRAVKDSVAAIYSKLPPSANIAIMKTSSSERSMIDYVVDQITTTVVQDGKLKVVDRNNRALIMAEQQFQLTGFVSDESAVSIGHQLGVQYMVMCWISGQSSRRQLNVSIVSVETAQNIYQASFEI